MKLVDILARELKVWPEGYDCLQQSFAGMVFHSASDGVLPVERLSVAEDFRTAKVTRAQWQAAVDALKAEVRPTESMALHHQEVGRITRQWNGEGLPPVGTVCEIEQSGSWNRVEVMYLSSCTLLLKFDGDEENDNEGAYDPLDPDINLRPIRMPEQIAAEKREADILEIFHATGLRKRDGGMEVAAAIYRAGYRKSEIVDN